MCIAQVLPYAEIGGTERHCLTLSHELIARGHEVFLVSPPGPALADLSPGLTHVSFSRWDRDLRRGIAGYLAALRSLQVDLVHVHAAAELVLLARRAVRCPLVFTVHGFHGRGAGFSYALARQAMRFADRTICVSRAEQSRLPRAVLIHNGVADHGCFPPPKSGLVGSQKACSTACAGLRRSGASVHLNRVNGTEATP